MNSHILQGDALERLRELPDESVDTVITDPPYGYSFMGKDWDKAVPSVEIWQECLRVLKPGAFACVMSAPRSDVQNAMISRLMEAGFRLDFTPIYWTYASGFPKAGNVGKLVDKRLGAEREVVGFGTPRGSMAKTYAHTNGTHGQEKPETNPITAAASPQAKALDGSYTGFQPKPAVEVIIVAMKPLSEKTYVDQALKNGKGITWLDDCRVPTGDEDLSKLKAFGDMPENKTDGQGFSRPWMADKENIRKKQEDAIEAMKTKGRFPANLLVQGQALNGHSKYFDLDAWADTLPFLAVPKASKSEKNKGLELATLPIKRSGGMEGRNRESGKGQLEGPTPMAKNHHPTVKPLKLMSYLITLFSREGDTVLDPFVGSGTTVVAAEQLGRKGIGIEREAEYAEIARARLAAEKSTVKQATFL